MAVNISLSDEAYRRLKRLKNGGESFSDVVMDLTEESRNDFSDLIGTDLGTEWDEVKEDRERSEGDERREDLLS